MNPRSTEYPPLFQPPLIQYTENNPNRLSSSSPLIRRSRLADMCSTDISNTYTRRYVPISIHTYPYIRPQTRVCRRIHELARKRVQTALEWLCVPFTDPDTASDMSAQSDLCPPALTMHDSTQYTHTPHLHWTPSLAPRSPSNTHSAHAFCLSTSISLSSPPPLSSSSSTLLHPIPAAYQLPVCSLRVCLPVWTPPPPPLLTLKMFPWKL